jgi:hypothetical protein
MTQIKTHAYEFFQAGILKNIERGYYFKGTDYDRQNTVILLIMNFIDLYKRYPYGHNLRRSDKDVVEFELAVTDSEHITHQFDVTININQLVRSSKIKKLKGIV